MEGGGGNKRRNFQVSNVFYHFSVKNHFIYLFAYFATEGWRVREANGKCDEIQHQWNRSYNR